MGTEAEPHRPILPDARFGFRNRLTQIPGRHEPLEHHLPPLFVLVNGGLFTGNAAALLAYNVHQFLQQFFAFAHFSLLDIKRRPYAIAKSNDAGRCCRRLSIITLLSVIISFRQSIGERITGRRTSREVPSMVSQGLFTGTVSTVLDTAANFYYSLYKLFPATPNLAGAYA
jgi:hypothetical protein